ncbi:MAG TPA: glycerate kinase [Spirochaetota bacterium]|nr:glycerate kinase [Spirochaetota bacterium]HPJ34798.1 glycerate kinase [Spirochaetota bacterium]
MTDSGNAMSVLESVFRAGLLRVDPLLMMKRQLKLEDNELTIDTGTEIHYIDLGKIKRILVIGMGKASARMALGLEEVLGDRIHSGIIAVKYGHTETLKKIRLMEAGHPVPDRGSADAAKEIISFMEGAGEGDLVINLVSGGGSAVMSSPYSSAGAAGITLEDKQAVSKLLLSCGAEIHEINCIRKHLSNIKGGRLAEIIHPARCLSLILSDVVGDNLDAIASGATVPDPTTFADAMKIVERYSLAEKMPGAVMDILKAGAEGKIPDTPGPGDPVFSSTVNILIGTNHHSLLAAAEEGARLGCRTEILTSVLTGEAREIAHFFAAIGREVCVWRESCDLPLCIIAGGETTVTLKGEGKGGRCQEMALAFIDDIRKTPSLAERVYFLAAGTDGNDGPTDAAGAFGSLEIYRKGKEAGLDPEDFITASDSYHYFEKTGGLLKTGPTGTNVCDIMLLLVV